MTESRNQTVDHLGNYLSYKVTLFSLAVTNSIVHTVGAYILFKVKTKKLTSQTILLFNLSTVDALANYMFSVYYGLQFLQSENSLLLQIHHYLLLVATSGPVLIAYLLMLLITLDRLLAVFFIFKYMKYWSTDKTAITAKVVWVVGLLVSITVSLANGFASFNWLTFTGKYINPISSVLFLLLASCTYTYIYKSYRKSDVRSHTRRSSRVEPSSALPSSRSRDALKSLLQSRFSISILIVLTYIFFAVIPNMVLLIINWKNKRMPLFQVYVISIFY